jgi:phosphatidylinositol-3-phosphatase
MTTMLRSLAVALCATLCLAAPALAAPRKPIRHVFVVLLENENEANAFGPGSPAPYLAQTLPAHGKLLPDYYAVTHLSMGNYAALLSGQGSNPETQSDCQVYTDFAGTGPIGPDGQAIGQGCVYPASVKTLADQLTAAKLTWKGYLEDMGNDPARESATCGHPAPNTPDGTQNATPTDQYAARHNPFVYFHSLLDTGACNANDVPLSRLTADLASVRTTPNYSFITPNLCNDGHDSPCADGRPGGLATADQWLRTWIPRILASPAYQRDGLLMVTFDEAESSGPNADASACCNEAQFPNTPNNGGPVPGRGGGRVGAVVLSPQITPRTVSTAPYNHFSFLRTVEDLFGLRHLGYAATPDPGAFGPDVLG